MKFPVFLHMKRDEFEKCKILGKIIEYNNKKSRHFSKNRF